jgi:hypothetical protein
MDPEAIFPYSAEEEVLKKVHLKKIIKIPPFELLLRYSTT